MTKAITNALMKLREKHRGQIPITAPTSNLIEQIRTLKKSNNPVQRRNLKRGIAYQLGKLEAALRAADGGHQ